jgi:iron complex outermembrane recepter protein
MTNVRRTLLATASVVVLLGIGSNAALAQDKAAPPPPTQDDAAPNENASDDKKVEKVTVVGSRIRRDTFNSPSPVQVITREDSILGGYNSTTDVLQGTGATNGSAQINNAFGGFVTDGGPGANTASLRGLGAGRTLVLINGRRVAPSGTRGSVGSADLNVLPSSIIDRIEILRDGASAIYGSDAVAGVVNVITRKVDGIIVEGQYNLPTNGGGDQGRASIVGGTTFGRLNLQGSFEYYKRDPLNLGDRDWTLCNTDYQFNKATGARTDFIDPRTGQPKCYPVTGTGSNGTTMNTIGTTTVAGVGAPGSVGTTFNRWRPNAAVVSGLVGFEGVGGGLNNLNVRDTFDPRMLNNSLISPANISTGFGEASLQLPELGDAELYAEILYTKRDSEQVGYRQLTLDYPKNSPLIPANLAFSTFLGAGGSVLTPGQVGVRAFIGFGNNYTNQEIDFIKGSGGLRGEFSFKPGWRYDLHYSFSQSDGSNTTDTWLTDKLANTLDLVVAPVGTAANLIRTAGGVDYTCRVNTTTPGEGCIPAPLLNPATIGGVLPQDWVNYTWRKQTGNTTYEEAVVSFDIDGPLFSLPHGEVIAAIGVEHRSAEIDDTPSIHSINNNLYNLTSATPTRGKDNVTETYAELEIPLLKEVPGFYDLTANVSGRYTDYASYGADSTYKIGLVYSPMEWLTFRGTKGTSYRAPALFEQFLGGTTGFLNQNNDPCNNWNAPGVNPIRAFNCGTTEALPPGFIATTGIQVVSAGGAAQGLAAETSENTTVGIIFQPNFLPESLGEIKAAVDYFDIEIIDGIQRPGALALLQLCYDDPLFRTGGTFCEFIQPRAVGTNGLIVNNNYTNISVQIVEGYDYNLRWTRDFWDANVLVDLSVTQFLTQPTALFANSPLREFNGTLNTPEYTGTLDTTVTLGDWRARYGVEWVSDMNSYALVGLNPATTTCVLDVPDYYLHKASVQYRADNWSATLGVKNILDEEPPKISAACGYNKVGDAPLYSGYDYVGRQLFLNVSKSF